MPMEPISANVFFARINSAFRFAEHAVRIAEVGSENAGFVRMIGVARRDLGETERLLSVKSVYAKLTSTPEKVEWVKGALYNTRLSLSEIGRWVEKARVDMETTGMIKLETHIRWVFNDHEKLLKRKAELSKSHQKLLGVLNYLTTLERTSINATTTNWNTTCFDGMLSPRQQMKQNIATESESKPNVSNVRNSIAPVPSNHHSTQSYTPSSPEFIPSVTPPSYKSAISVKKSLQNICSPPHNPRKAPLPYPDDNPIDQPRLSMPSFSLEHLDKNLETKYSTKTYGYMYPSLEKSVPKVEGGIVMSGNNNLGPVDIHELWSDTSPLPKPDEPPKCPFTQDKSENNNVCILPELLGDFSFPAELPAELPSSPPNYHRPRHMSSPGHLQSTIIRRPLSYQALPRPSLATLPKDIAGLPSQINRPSSCELKNRYNESRLLTLFHEYRCFPPVRPNYPRPPPSTAPHTSSDTFSPRAGQQRS